MNKYNGWAESAWNADKVLARWYERDNPTNLTPAQAQAQQEIMDAALSNPHNETENSITRAEARRNEIMCRTVQVVTETRDKSETGGGAGTCAQWALMLLLAGVAIVCAVILAILATA